MASEVLDEFRFPPLKEGSCVNWFDCAAWTIRANVGVFPRRAKSTITIRALLGGLWNHCERLDVSVSLAARLDGMFYVVEVDAERDEDDYKLGFSVNVDRRIATYKTIAPNAEYLHCWPTRKSWEQTVIDCVFRNVADCSRVGDSEVVRCDNVVQLVVCLNDFFVMMRAVEPDEIVGHFASEGTITDLERNTT